MFALVQCQYAKHKLKKYHKITFSRSGGTYNSIYKPCGMHIPECEQIWVLGVLLDKKLLFNVQWIINDITSIYLNNLGFVQRNSQVLPVFSFKMLKLYQLYLMRYSNWQIAFTWLHSFIPFVCDKELYRLELLRNADNLWRIRIAWLLPNAL